MQSRKLKPLPKGLSPVPVKAKAEAVEKLSEVRSSQAYFRS
jgi:hypothetical protein